jgi:hypothetical protein
VAAVNKNGASSGEDIGGFLTVVTQDEGRGAGQRRRADGGDHDISSPVVIGLDEIDLRRRFPDLAGCPPTGMPPGLFLPRQLSSLYFSRAGDGVGSTDLDFIHE